MRGHITQRSKKKGTWSIVLELGKDAATGKRRQKWVTFQGSQKDAKKRLTELLHQLDTGSYVNPSKQTVDDYLNDWLKNTAYPNMTPRTYEGYRDVIRRHIIPALGQIPLTQASTSAYTTPLCEPAD